VSEVVRLYQYKSLLSEHRAVTAEELMAKQEISRATFKRDIAKLRDQLHVPIKFDRDRGGYVLEQGPGHTDSELPGLWFSPEEVLALVTIQQLLTQLAPGLLGAKLRPMQARLAELMEKNGLAGADVAKRIKLTHASGKRRLKPQIFEAVAAATLGRKRLGVKHFNRQNGQTLERDISPQRLVNYRDNWYVDAWCHLREDLRSFSIDALASVNILDTAAKEIADKRLDEVLGASYGIFRGAPKSTAVLKFNPQRARWVRREEWHPAQDSREEADGSYVLSVPYSDEREIVGDILRLGADVRVLEPKELRRKVQQAALAMVNEYV
jgi:predicted DNA-binding transcriptional regulator YafY